MKRTLLVIAVLAIAVFAGGMFYISVSSLPTGRVDAMKILAATKTYAADLEAKGLAIPATVSLQELINRRLLNPSDVSGFAAAEVTVTLSADHSRPQQTLVRVRLPDGEEVSLLADGSVQSGL